MGPTRRVCLRDMEFYGLLVAVYPVFDRALPDVSEASSNMAALSVNVPVPTADTAKQDSSITALRDDIKRLSLTFKKADGLSFELSDELHEEALCHLQVILHCFEELVHDREDGSGNTLEPTSELPKLEWVRKHPEEAQCFVSFGTQRNRHTKTRAAAKVFSGFVDKVDSSTRDASKEASFNAAQDDKQTTLPRLDDALCLAEKVPKLFDALQTASCVSDKKHNGFFRLPDDLGKTTLDMVLSVCGEGDLWQQVHFDLQQCPTNEGKAAKNICLEMSRTLRSRKRMDMALDATDNGWYLRTVRNPTKPAAFARPNKTLRDALNVEYQNAATTQDATTPKQTSGKLPRLAKAKLGVRIAATLFCLFASPLFQLQYWDMADFHILQNDAAIADGDPTPPAYLSFCLDGPRSPPIGQQRHTETVDMPSMLKERHIRADDGNHLLLALTVSLLELESGGKILLSPDDDFDKELNAESLYFAAMRCLEERKYNLEATTYDAIQSCLDIYEDSIDASEKGYHTRIQTALFNDVFTPLACRHDRLWKPMLQLMPTDHPVAGYANGRQSPSSSTNQLRGPPQPLSTINEYGDQHQSEGRLLVQTTAGGTAGPSVSKQAQDSSVWLKDVDAVNELIDGVSAEHPTDRKVRVAILDTGCNLKAMCITSLGLNVLQLKKRWKDWVHGATEPIDEDEGSHGTATAALLLRVAKHADVYIARVIKDTNGLSSAHGSIAEAITHAVHVWNVDIVSMSFGFHGNDVTQIQNAINEATTARSSVDRGILFFAAANNQGLNQKEMFPAHHRDVIAVRGTDHMGKFLQEYNCDPWPSKETECRFGTLASEVPYDCVDATCCKSGCSIATPILTGLVATIIQYMEHRGDDGDPRGDLRKGIRKREGIIQVMKLLTDRQHVERYLTPGSFFAMQDNVKIALVTAALASLPQ